MRYQLGLDLLTSMLQPLPYAAIELIHKQPVRWTKSKVVSCDGGGGPLGHPKVFINTDKAEIVPCGYCGVPFVCLLALYSPMIGQWTITDDFLGPRTTPSLLEVPPRHQLPSRAHW
jgi:uncharacterized Zn-finger protein